MRNIYNFHSNNEYILQYSKMTSTGIVISFPVYLKFVTIISSGCRYFCSLSRTPFWRGDVLPKHTLLLITSWGQTCRKPFVTWHSGDERFAVQTQRCLSPACQSVQWPLERLLYIWQNFKHKRSWMVGSRVKTRGTKFPHCFGKGFRLVFSARFNSPYIYTLL